MFSKSTCIALFTLAASTFSAQALPAKGQTFETDTFCNTVTVAISTVVQTSTVEVTKYITAAGSSSTGSSSSNSGSSNSGSSGSGSQNNNGKGNNGSGSTDTTTTAAAASTTAASSSGSSSSGNQGSSGSKGSSGNKGSSSGNKGDNGKGSTLNDFIALDPSVICTGFEDDGQNPPVTGQTASSTSKNNYINFCSQTLPKVPLTNGLQITTGSCNPVPIGSIPSTANMPSAKFTFPQNMATIAANVPFNISMELKNMQAGSFTNAQKTYFAAPQFLNSGGQIVGHAHFVVEALSAIDQTAPTDPQKFVFFKGINDAGVNGILSTPVATGFPAGAYRLCSINSASNHQPVIVPIAQHGSLDDCVYGGNKGAAPVAVASSAAAPAAPAATVDSGAKGGKGAVAASAPPAAASASAAPAAAIPAADASSASAAAFTPAPATAVKAENGKSAKGGKNRRRF
ncbi:hypothetical protein B0H13DRAFT_2237689 [Mycena leptocephala]|nr:hypothetical protein B0H13DRAFT_2237689 [Mycena leptocephala]